MTKDTFLSIPVANCPTCDNKVRTGYVAERDGPATLICPIIRCAYCTEHATTAWYPGQEIECLRAWEKLAGPYTPPNSCAVTSGDGEHCKEPPVYRVKVKGKPVDLCDGCYDAWISGAYGGPGAYADDQTINDGVKADRIRRRQAGESFKAQDEKE